LNSGLCACKTGALLLEAHLHPYTYIFKSSLFSEQHDMFWNQVLFKGNPIDKNPNQQDKLKAISI
jgi:hypothetical protein